MSKLFLIAIMLLGFLAVPADARCVLAQQKHKARLTDGNWLVVYESSAGERVQVKMVHPEPHIMYNFRLYEFCRF